MRTRDVCLVALCFVASAACGGSGSGATSPGAPSLPSPHDLSVPPGAVQFLVRFERETLPNWRVRAAVDVAFKTTTEIRVEIGRPIALTLLSDQAGQFLIPAMRIDRVLPADKSQVAWFTATKAGTYDVLVRSGTQQCDGKLIVESRK